MTQNQIQQEITIIKQMIAKTRRATAQSGLIFIIPGIILILMVTAIHIFEYLQLYHLVIPTVIISVTIVALVSFIIGLTVTGKQKVETYVNHLFGQIWIACGIGCIITGFLFPIFKMYNWNLIALVCWPAIGIGFYLTGVIFEIQFVKWAGIIWWIGALIMAFIPGQLRFIVVILTILIAYILPGLILNRKYKIWSQKNEA
jgi:hypothetical protein